MALAVSHALLSVRVAPLPRALTSIPSPLSGNYTTLLLNNNGMTSIQSGAFHNLPKLGHIDLSHTLLNSIAPGVFDNQTQVSLLNLHDSFIPVLPIDIFWKMQGLRVLLLSDGRFFGLKHGYFGKLAGLTHLQFWDNYVQLMPAGMFDDCLSLTYLDLSINRSGTLPAGIFDNLKKLSHLYLNNNHLVSLPPLVFDELSAIVYLRLHANQFDFQQSKCAIRSVYERNVVPQVDGSVQSAVSAGLNASTCGSRPLLCYSRGVAMQALFCGCSQGEIFNGTLCIQTGSACTQPAAPVTTSCFTRVQCFRGNFNYPCQCPFGQRLNDSMCVKTQLLSSTVTNTSVTVKWTSPSFVIAGPVVRYRTTTILVANATFPVATHNTLTVPVAQTTATVSELLPGYKYTISIAESDFIALNVTTTQEVPDTPQVNRSILVRNLSMTILSTSSRWTVQRYCFMVQPISGPPVIDVCQSSHHLSIAGLMPFTTYVLSVYVINTAGNASSSWTRTATTGEDVPSSSPRIDTAYAISESAVNITWQALLQVEVNGALLGHNIFVREDTATFNRTIQTPANTSNLVIRGLQPYTVYWISISAFTKIGTGPFSNETEVLTNESVPSQSPMATVVQATSKSNIRLTWVPLAKSEVNGVLLGYNIVVREDATSVNRTIQTPANTSNLVIRGLQPYTVYWVAVSAFTKIGSGPYSVGMHARTNASVPSTSPILTGVRGVGKSQIDLSWTPLPLSKVNGVLLGYKINVRDSASNFNLTLQTSAGTTTSSITGLQPGTQYWVSVSAFTEIGTGPYSKDIQAKTKRQDQFCLGESTTDERGTFTWNRTLSNTTAVAPCSLTLNDSLAAVATRHCGIPGTPDWTWSSPDTTFCPFLSATTRQFQQLADDTQLVNLTEEAILSAVILTVNVIVNATQLTSTDVKFTAAILENVVESGLSAIVNETTALQVSQSIVVILDTILDIPKASIKQESASKISLAVESFFRAVPLAANETYRQVEENIAVVVNCPEPQMNEIVQAHVVDGNLSIEFGKSTDTANLSDLTTISIPSTAIQKAAAMSSGSTSSCPSARTSYVRYQVTSLFQDPRLPDLNQELASGVMLGQVGSSSLSDLKDPVLLTFKINITGEQTTRKVSGYSCVFWNYSLDTGVGGWSTEGCTLVKPVAGDIVECQCSHLTNFACIVSYKPVENTQPLSVITYIGCGLSLLGLLATVISCLVFKVLRESNHQRLMVGLCLTLILLLLFFLIGMERKILSLSDRACSAVAMIQHYLLLCTFSWTSAVATLLYNRLVVVFANFSISKLRKLIAATLVLPLFIVAITAGSSQGNVYTNDQFCWLNSIYAFVGAVYVPLAISLIYNTTILVLIIRSLKNRRGLTKASPSSDESNVLKLARITVILSVLLGLTWSFSAFVILLNHVALQYIFAIFNTLQGLFIFLLHTVRSPEVRAEWSRTISTLNIRSRLYSADRSSSTPFKRLSTSRDASKPPQLRESIALQNLGQVSVSDTMQLTNDDLCCT